MKATIALVFSLLAAAPIHALDVACEPSSSPLLKVTQYNELTGPPPPGQFRTLLLVCKDRRWLRAGTAEATGFQMQGTLTSAVAKEESFRVLTSRMAAARIGFMNDCSFNGDAPLVMRVTWFGRPGRIHSFTVYSDAPNQADPCTPEELDLVHNIHFESTQFTTVSFP